MPTEGFTFNNVHSSTHNIYLQPGEIELLPDTRDNFEEIPGRHGVYDFGVFLDKRNFELDCILLCSSRSELIQKSRDIAKWLNPMNGYKTLIFDRESDKQYYARYSGNIELTSLVYAGEFTLKFVASDPFAYSVSTSSVAINNGIITNITNSGTWETYPVITLTPTGTLPVQVHNYTTGQLMVLGNEDNPISGSQIVVDCKEMTVLEGELPSMKIHSGDFIKLVPGSNSIKSVNASGTISYKRCWL